MALPPKFCPECGEEYVHAATLCAHCRVPLALSPPPEDAPRGLPPASELQLVRVASASFADSLSALLAEAGIAHRVELLEGETAAGRERAAGSCGVFVRREDAEAALAIDARHLRKQIPDLPEEGAPAASEGACPACGEPVGETAVECASCGLPFLDADA